MYAKHILAIRAAFEAERERVCEVREKEEVIGMDGVGVWSERVCELCVCARVGVAVCERHCTHNVI